MDIPVTLRDFKDIKTDIFNELTKGKKYTQESLRTLKNTIHDFVSNPNPKMLDFTKAQDRVLWKLYKKFAYEAKAPVEGRTYRNNKIVEMTYEVLTHETNADKVLNPGGFDQQKKMGYMVAAYKQHPEYSWKELEELGNSKDGIDKLKDLCYTEKNLCFIDTHLQFYKQNNAAGSLIGTFAVHKVAHAILESDGFQVDVQNICGEFTIDGMKFSGSQTLDPRYDRKGNFIGKTLGSLVASAADAVKDPVLNLMNINSNTSNVLNTLIRLGMDFDTAAMFLSQTAITKILEKFNVENINDYKSLNTIIKERIQELEETYSINEDLLLKEELSKEEMIEGLQENIDNISPKIEYKVLKIFNNLQSIGNAVRSATLATRFNSISSAVGPLIIDNLITEYKIANFSDKLLYQGTPCDIEKILELHPYLEKFYDTLNIAKELIGNMPANSSGFRGLLNSARSYKDVFFTDRKLLSQLSDFYQSYVMIASGAINSSHLNDYINNFPKQFIKQKYKEQYKDNALIQAIKLDTTEDGRAILKIDTTGMKVQEKEMLSAAWVDLHKKNPKLSEQLFLYNFFRGGIGFNPKTFMQLVPTYVKQRIPNYVETYRKLPTVVNGLVLDQFIRNNWNNNKLVPVKKIALEALPSNNQEFQVVDESRIDEMKDVLYFKTVDNKGNYTIWRQVKGGKDAIIVTYKKVSALGNKGEYLEISNQNIEQSLQEQQINTLFDTPDNGVQDNNPPSEVEVVEETNLSDKNIEDKLIDLAERAFQTSPKVTTREQAQAKIQEYKNKSERDQKKLEKQMKKFLNNALSKLGITVDETLVNKVYNKIC